MYAVTFVSSKYDRLDIYSTIAIAVLGTVLYYNTLRPRQNGRHFPDDIFKWIFLNENVWISINISLMFVPRGPINNIPTLVQVMAWRRPGDKPLSEPMMVRLPMHICVTRPHWDNWPATKRSNHNTVVGFNKANCLCSVIFRSSETCGNTGNLLNITFIFDRCLPCYNGTC